MSDMVKRRSIAGSNPVTRNMRDLKDFEEGRYVKEPDKDVKVLNNTWSKYRRCVAFCFRHHVYLTELQLKNRQCCRKQCKHCIRLPHPYWEKKKKQKEHKRNTRKNYGI